MRGEGEFLAKIGQNFNFKCPKISKIPTPLFGTSLEDESCPFSASQFMYLAYINTSSKFSHFLLLLICDFFGHLSSENLFQTPLLIDPPPPYN